VLIAAIEPTLNTTPWRFQFHPEIWILVVGLVVAFVYDYARASSSVWLRFDI
jgi:hypothetical protein